MKTIYYFLLLFVLSFAHTSIFAQAPEIVQQPESEAKCVGESTQFKVLASGEEPFQYQWYFEGNAVGTNSSVLEINDISNADNGFYYCEVSNAQGSVDSEMAMLVVVENAPTINSFSNDQTLCQGEQMQLDVDVTAEIASYQWFKQGVENYVHYGQTYTIANTSIDDAGVYYCKVSNVCGLVSTDSIYVDIISLPSFVSMPQSTTICEGEDLTFTMEVSGDDIAYKWLANGDEIVGETASSLVLENISYPHSIIYTPIAYNSCAQIQGLNLSVNVKSIPHITGNPISQSDCGEVEITLYATATSNSDLTYQWYFNEDLYEGETSSSLDIVIEAGAEDAYYCIITNECASVSTDTAIITGMTSPIITSHPIDNIVCAGNDAEFACKASGTEPLSYRWLFNDATLVFANAVGEETNTVQLNNAYLGQAGLYSCFVYNQCGSTTSDEAELTINSLPFINLQADDIVVCEGEEINIAVPIIGTEPITYQWIYLETDEEISTDSTFIIQNITKEQEGNYYLILENICGAVSSDTFNITVNTYPNILSVPEDILTCEGESIDFGIEYEGTEPFEFLWYRNNSAISTETNAEINIASAHSGHTGAYFCKISNICGELDSETFNVLVGTHPSIQWSSGDKYLCENDTLLLELSPNGEVLFFEWTLNGDIIPNANDSILLIPLVNASQAGEYQGRVFNECSEVFTNIINVNISVAPELDLGPDIEVCEGTTLTLSPEGDFNSYLWNDGESTAPWLDVAESGIYFVKVLGDNGCYNYDTVQVTFHPLVFVDLGEDFANCGSTEISGPDGAYSYLWSNGSTEQTILVSESNTYWLKTLGSEFGCESSDTINIIIDEIPSIDLGADHVIAEDSSINIGVDAIYHSYMWNNGFNGPVQTFVGSELTLGSHKIWLRVATEHNCTASDTVYITVIPAQSIASFDDANKISIYPNPVKDYLHIQSDLFQSESCVINLLDIQGRKIMEFTENYGEKNHWLIDCSALKSGLYFVEINLEGGSRFVKKLSVQ